MYSDKKTSSDNSKSCILLTSVKGMNPFHVGYNICFYY